MSNVKSPSQRLRAVLFLLWEQQGSWGDFDTWYKAKIEEIIEHFKGKLT